MHDNSTYSYLQELGKVNYKKKTIIRPFRSLLFPSKTTLKPSSGFQTGFRLV